MSKERSIKEQAKALQLEVGKLSGNAFKLSAAQEMLARVYGYANWNTMVALNRDGAESGSSPALVRMPIVAYADGEFLEIREKVTVAEFKEWAQGVLASGMPIVKVEGFRAVGTALGELVAEVTLPSDEVPQISGLDGRTGQAAAWRIVEVSDRFGEIRAETFARFPLLCREVEDSHGDLTELGQRLDAMMRPDDTFFACLNAQWGVLWQFGYPTDEDDLQRPFGTLETREYYRRKAVADGAALVERLGELAAGVAMLATFGPHTWNGDAALWVFIPAAHPESEAVQDAIESWHYAG